MLYIKPPRGDIQLCELQECVITRINYFLLRYQQDPAVSKNDLKFEYLQIGTALDRIGHFILRLLSLESQLVKEFIISSEATFTIERLEFLSSDQIVQLIKTTIRHIDEVGEPSKSDTLWNTQIKYIFNKIKSAFKSAHIRDFNHDILCTAYVLKIPFEMCVSLVAKRELELEKGKIIVPCGKWKQFLRCFFEAHVKREISKMESKGCVAEIIADQRLIELRDIVHKKVVNCTINGSNKDKVRLTDLNKVKILFPPCMGYLYSNLKINHRLSHHARFNLSLFLKDIGMSLNESISFWQEEYSKPSKCGGKCSHSWQKNGPKYIYSIRHLYGLEGKRANYCSPSCSKIQNNNLGPSEEGGCPFLTFDHCRLKNSLDPSVVQNQEDFEKVLFLTSQSKPMAACKFYRKTLMKTASVTSLTDKEHKTPVEYFVILHKHFSLDFR
ncbi:DNA primase large subunit-like isoform X1 [Homalodisca vitripennis]|uniref:DNA primase large subunit-like isoform X1 n=1 Tax=Homalodisca vitripennis TaxID=197043 RepID=UPI001EEA2601|nr:DNA primase large subunit-like isoform X1 [Homalodisca vitripennis]